jgi:hypothetical protein
MGRLVKNPKINPGALAVQIPTVTTGQRPTGINGDIIYNSTTGTFQAYDNGWANISTGNSAPGTITIDNFQGDGTTTVFGNGSGNMDDSTAAQLSFSVTDPTDILVFIGGVYQIPTVNYTVGGNTITFGSAPSANDGASNDHIITIIHGLNKLGE